MLDKRKERCYTLIREMKKSIVFFWSLLILILAFSLSCAPRATKKENCKQFADKANKFLYVLPDSAKLYLEKTIACSSDYVDAYIILAKLYAEDEQYEEAESTYKYLISNNPRNAKGYSGLGLILLKMTRYDHAIVEYEKGISVDPNDASIYHGLGFVYEEMDEFAKAESLYEIAHKLDPENYTIMYALAGVYLENGKCEAAIPLLEEIEKLYPEDREVTLSLADAYYDCRDYSEALQKYLLLKPHLPDNSSFYLKIGKCYEGLEQYDNAAAYLDTAIEKSDNKLIPFYHIINMYIRIKDFQRAEKYAKDAFDFAPDDLGLFAMTGDIYFGYGEEQRKNEENSIAISNYNTAIACYKKAGQSTKRIQRAEALIKEMQAARGTVSGRITLKSNGKPIAFSNILVIGTTTGTVSDLSGKYSFSLLPGTYDIQARMLGLINKTKKGIKVGKDKTTTVDFQLDHE
jgi:tetratricopeptide (TPR) repeat protein